MTALCEMERLATSDHVCASAPHKSPCFANKVFELNVERETFGWMKDRCKFVLMRSGLSGINIAYMCIAFLVYVLSGVKDLY